MIKTFSCVVAAHPVGIIVSVEPRPSSPGCSDPAPEKEPGAFMRLTSGTWKLVPHFSALMSPHAP